MKRMISFLLACCLMWGVFPFSGFQAKAATTNPLPFTDVTDDAWYKDAVAYVWENDLFSGTCRQALARVWG